MPIDPKALNPQVFCYLLYPSTASVGDILTAYKEQNGKFWWVLVSQSGAQFHVCTFGSLLPYLAGQTPHIVHDFVTCALCGGLSPIFWQETAGFVEETLSNPATCARNLADLPMLELETVDADSMDTREFHNFVARRSRSRIAGVTRGGDQFIGFYADRMRGGPAMPGY